MIDGKERSGNNINDNVWLLSSTRVILHYTVGLARFRTAATSSAKVHGNNCWLIGGSALGLDHLLLRLNEACGVFSDEEISRRGRKGAAPSPRRRKGVLGVVGVRAGPGASSGIA